MTVQVDGEPWLQPPGEVVVFNSALKVCSHFLCTKIQFIRSRFLNLCDYEVTIFEFRQILCFFRWIYFCFWLLWQIDVSLYPLLLRRKRATFHLFVPNNIFFLVMHINLLHIEFYFSCNRI